jgi:hypothetical protein
MTLNPIDQPLIFFVLTLAIMLFAARAGLYFRRRRGPMSDDERDELTLVLTSSLTLLALIIGFSFSMAVGRYDTRKSNEATEGNAIETEYSRAGLLSAPESTRLRALLRQYVDERIATYSAENATNLLQHRASSKTLHHEMWSIVENAAAKRQNSITALVAQGMNDLIDAQGSSAAAWSNRIPLEGWTLMFAIAVCCCSLIGFDTKINISAVSGHLILPLLIAISFYLIADLDTSHAGIIRVSPENLITTQEWMRG